MEKGRVNIMNFLKHFNESIKLLSHADKKIMITIFMIVSCMCFNTVYFYIEHNKAFVELELFKLLLLLLSCGIASHLILMFISIIVFEIYYWICKENKELYDELLFAPAILNNVFYICLIAQSESSSALFAAVYIMFVIAIVVLISRMISGFNTKYKDRKSNKQNKVYDIQNSYPSDPRTIFIKEIEIRHRRFHRLKKDLSIKRFMNILFSVLAILLIIEIIFILVFTNDFELSKIIFTFVMTVVLSFMSAALNLILACDNKRTELFEICKYLDIHNNLTDQEKKFYDKQLD